MAKECFLINRHEALVPASADAEEALRAFPLGAQLRVKITQKRSLPHNNFYWAFISHCYPHWPEHHKYPLRDEEHLHAWLAVNVNWCEEHVSWLFPDIKTAGLMATYIITLVKQLVGHRPFWQKIEAAEGGARIVTRWPRSIAFDKMDEEEYKRFTTRVFDVIYEKIGIDVDDFYMSWEKTNGGLNVKPQRNRTEAENGLYFS